jgi:hypothetical protein
MTFEELKDRLTWIESQWGDGCLDDQEFDAMAADAAMKWAADARQRIMATGKVT